MTLLDCTFRDGGYYTDWDFPKQVVNQYLKAVHHARIDVAELGFRFKSNVGFKGACAFTTDAFLDSLEIPEGLEISVMVNADDIVVDGSLDLPALMDLFPRAADESVVSLVRIACHYRDLAAALPAIDWLTDRGYRVGINLMQISRRTPGEIRDAAESLQATDATVLYFADSLGSLNPRATRTILETIREHWAGDIGIHAHDNMELALQNTLTALEHGASWADATVLGMGRGPGNTRTEHLVQSVGSAYESRTNIAPLLTLIRKTFEPMKRRFNWGTNAYYFMAGKRGIHPSYVQRMLTDHRYRVEDILSVMDRLSHGKGENFKTQTLELARQFYSDEPQGQWNPRERFEGREVLIVATGESASLHREALESYIERKSPVVMALNAKPSVSEALIDVRAACHPIRLLADIDDHAKLQQPLITPYSMLQDEIRVALSRKELLDFGLSIKEGTFEFREFEATIPSTFVIAYVLAIVTSGRAKNILLAGFDGYGPNDPRTTEVERIFETYMQTEDALRLESITPTEYTLDTKSVYGM